MPDSRALMRTGLNTALAYTLPLLAWLLGQSLLIGAGQANAELSMRVLFSTLLFLQACALTLCIPWLLRGSSRSGHFYAVTVVLLVPLPLFALAWLAGSVADTSLLLALACLFCLAAILYTWYTLCLALTRPGQLRSLLLSGTQLLALGFYWNYRADWQGVLGL